MKKILCVLAVFICILTTAAAEVDLSGMNYDELVALKDQINKAIWESEEWQEVTVPQGTWQVGEDIPVGHWTVKAADGASLILTYCSKIEGPDSPDYSGDMVYMTELTSTSRSNYDPNKDKTETDIEMSDGMYVIVQFGSAVFTPYSGKPSLGFK